MSKSVMTRAAIAIVLACSTAGHAATLFVNSAAADCGDGQTWATACKHLQDALAATHVPGSGITEIWVAAGTYRPDRDCAHPTGTGNRTATFQLITGVAIRGGFAGNEDPATFNLGSRDLAAHLTILSGDLAGNDGANFANNAENSYHVVTGSGTATSAVLDGFAITAGNANAAGANYYGAGMYTSSGNPTVTSCTFSGNAARVGGGVFAASSGGLSLTNCVFTVNSASNGGAGMYNSGGNPAVTNCTFFHNIGSGFYASGGPTLTNCILWGNTSGQVSGSVTVTYSCVQGGYTGQGNISDDPVFMSEEDLHLATGSPCIDAGNNVTLPTGVSQDRDGFPRFLDDWETEDTGNAGSPPRAVVDMGAYEYQPPPPPPPPCILVNDDAPAGGDGTSWAKAYRYLQDALAAAPTRPEVKEIWVAAGTYKPDRDAAHPNGTGSRAATFQLLNNIAIRGGFAGNENYATFNLATRDFAAHPTILSGGLFSDGLGYTNSLHVVIGSGGNESAILDGFRISYGVASSRTGTTFYGAGMYNAGGSPTVTNCTFSENSAYYEGHPSGGGGMYNTASSPTLINCVFDGNIGYLGGGMYNASGSNPRLHNCTFSDNKAEHGGGLYNLDSSPVLVNCALIRNSCYLMYSGDGAGAWNSGGNPIFTSCSFEQNNARRGAGMYASSGAPTLNNCAFFGNTAGVGGGVFDTSSSGIMLINSTLTKNKASSFGGGICGNSILASCILWGNTLWGDVTDQIYGSATVSYSCIQGGWTGEGNISTDPLFVNAAGGDLRLRVGSPCIDAGSNAAVPAGVMTDLDGRARFVDIPCVADCVTAPGTCGTAPIVDMGAYEYTDTPQADLDRSGTVNAADFDKFLAAFGHGGCDEAYNPEADFDGDGTITLVDYQSWLQAYRAAVNNPQAPAPLEVLGDFQRDGRVNEPDADHILECQTGSMVAQNDPACRDADMDGDTDVDQDDFGVFQRCVTGDGGIDLTCKQ